MCHMSPFMPFKCLGWDTLPIPHFSCLLPVRKCVCYLRMLLRQMAYVLVSQSFIRRREDGLCVWLYEKISELTYLTWESAFLL